MRAPFDRHCCYAAVADAAVASTTESTHIQNCIPSTEIIVEDKVYYMNICSRPSDQPGDTGAPATSRNGMQEHQPHLI